MRRWRRAFAVAGFILMMFGVISLGLVNLKFNAGPPRGTIWIYTPRLYTGSSEVPNYKIEDVYLTLYVWPNASGRLDLELAVTFYSQTQFGFGILQPFSVVKGFPLDSISDEGLPRTDKVSSTGELVTTIWFNPKLGYAIVGLGVIISNPFASVEIGKRKSYLSFFRGLDAFSNKEIADFTLGLEASHILNFGSVTFAVNFPTEWYLSLTETLPIPDKSFTVEGYNAAYWQLDLKRPPVNLAETITVTMTVPSEISVRDWLIFLGGSTTGIGAGVFSNAILQVLEQRERRRILRHTSIEPKVIERDL